ncbi:pickpocket protein 11-like [Musca domestica]|uniref:Pickpocket protein 11-like n=1 Tax=Musca domestica TaxID=7370 RepID=A0A1I8ME83_MUSDO|nr:pickpocket protein 11-like [Musca domestica]
MEVIAIDMPTSPPKVDMTKKPKRMSCCQALKKSYVEFCATSSIHGFQYFGHSRNWKEKCFWMLVFVVSLYFCGSMIYKAYVKWHETPVIVTISEKSTPIWSIPFPAVTICPETKRAINETVLSYSELLLGLQTYIERGEQFSENFTSSDLEDILTLLQLCDVQTNASISSDFNAPEINFIGQLNKLLPDFRKYCFSCGWFGVETTCDRFFMKVYTDEGICFTFNSLKATDLYREDTYQHQESLSNSELNISMFNQSLTWSLEQGFTTDGVLNTYPARVLGSGTMAGFLTVLQNFAREVDYSCRYVADGFKVLLHSPDDVPSLAKHFVHISMDKDVMIAVKPKMITTSSGIAEYPPHKRQCYLNKDRPLRYFKAYSQNNCELECLTNFTLQLCGCVTFYMPRSLKTPVCDSQKLNCYRQAKDQLLFQQFMEGLKHPQTTLNNCDCLPACTALDYETEISEGSFNVANTINAVASFREMHDLRPDLTMSMVWIYFKDNEFITSRRSELYGLTDLMANFGGVCGLFMGVSLLSIIEMLYHFTLRFWWNLGHPKDKK